MKIKIISDSTCDLSKELIEKYDIAIVPLTVIKDGQNFRDCVDITTADIFAHVAGGGSLCSTAALNIEEYTDVFSRYAGQYDGVVHINISSGFSSCYQNARLAAEEFDNVRVIDSKNLSTGQGLVVLRACELAQTCQSLDELVEKLEAIIPKVEASFLLDRLEYMVKALAEAAAVLLYHGHLAILYLNAGLQTKQVCTQCSYGRAAATLDHILQSVQKEADFHFRDNPRQLCE